MVRSGREETLMMLFHAWRTRCISVMVMICGIKQALAFCSGASDCSNNGACYTTYCQCKPGYFGDRCQDDCNADTDCNGGTCATTPGGKVCNCLSTNYGRQCKEDQACTSDAECQNGGTCDQAPAVHVCDCAPGFSGKTCRNVCTGNADCNGGSCVTENGVDVCSCPATLYGDLCENSQICANNTDCLNGGTCNEAVEVHVCDCSQGYSGRTCSDACMANTDCNGGTCVDGPDGKVCNCTETQQGTWCENSNVSTNLRLSHQLLPLLMLPVMYKGHGFLW